MVQSKSKKRRFSLLKILSCVSTHESREDIHTTIKKPINTSPESGSEDRLSVDSSQQKNQGSENESPSSKSATLRGLFKRSKRQESTTNRVVYSDSDSNEESDTEEPVFLERNSAGEPEIKIYIPGQTTPTLEIHVDEPTKSQHTIRKFSESKEGLEPQEPISQTKKTLKHKSESGKDDSHEVRLHKPTVKRINSISCHDLRTAQRVNKAEEIIAKYNIKPRKSNSGEDNCALNVPRVDKSKFGSTSNVHRKSATELFASNKSSKRTKNCPSTEKLTQLQLDMRERGEKVSMLDDSSQRLRVNLSAFSKSTSHLAQAYKDKKWWQL